MRAVRIHEVGGVDKIRVEQIAVPEPKAGEVRFRVVAAGLNYIDTYKRSGLYAVPLPHTLGQEAAGVITAVGEGVTQFRVGDRVGSVAAVGAYADETIAPVAQLVRIPEGIDLKQAAAVLLQGMTAHFLACDTFPLKRDDTALVHAAAGGLGSLLVQIAKLRGARVLATVGSDAKAALAREAGADTVCVYTRENFAEAARAFTAGRGVDVVYDGVGQATFDGSLNSLRPRGMMVSFGNASGVVPEFKPLLLSQKGSLFFTRPTLVHYTATPSELARRADDLFAWIKAGKLTLRIGAVFPLAQANEAHEALESRSTSGKVLIVP